MADSLNTAGRVKLRTSALRAYTMLLALIVIWLFFQWATIDQNHPYGLFLGAINFSKLLQQMAVTGVLAVGMLMVIVCGNIDLSVGAVGPINPEATPATVKKDTTRQAKSPPPRPARQPAPAKSRITRSK